MFLQYMYMHSGNEFIQYVFAAHIIYAAHVLYVCIVHCMWFMVITVLWQTTCTSLSAREHMLRFSGKKQK